MKIDVRFRERSFMLIQEISSKTHQPMSVVVRALVEKSLRELIDKDGYINLEDYFKR